MKNTFWTLIDNEYYRIHNGVLKYAPICNDTKEMLSSKEEEVKVISAELLEKVNNSLGTNLTISNL